MRIISQDGNKDFPYERCTVWILDNKIIASPVGDPETDSRMATYSTREKAEKAMLLLHRIYAKAPLENNAKEMGEFVRGTFKAIGTSGYVEPESNYFVFRFPREDEI